MRFFFVRTTSFSMGGSSGEAFGLAGFLYAPVFQRCYLSPSRLEAGYDLIAYMEIAMIDTSQSPRTSIKADHKPFSWLADERRMDTSAQFMALTLDLSQGIQTCLSLVHASNLARELDDEESPPVLDVPDTERLTRMTIAVVGMLSERAERYIDVFNKLREGCK